MENTRDVDQTEVIILKLNITYEKQTCQSANVFKTEALLSYYLRNIETTVEPQQRN